MKIEMKKFGELLISRPAGREAIMAAAAYLLSPLPDEEDSIHLDFEGVCVVTPSWLDEFLTGLKDRVRNPIRVVFTSNPTVIESLKVIEGSPIIDSDVSQ